LNLTLAELQKELTKDIFDQFQLLKRMEENTVKRCNWSFEGTVNIGSN